MPNKKFLSKTCPSCKNALNVSPKRKGKSLTCSKCGAVLQCHKSTGQLTLESEAAGLAKPLGFMRKHRTAMIVVACGLVLVSPVLLGMLLPFVNVAFEKSHRSACSENLRVIHQALGKYHEENGHWPPAYTVDEQGKPLHSWRSLILPFLGQQALFDQIDFSKPWDHPANRAAAETVVSVYQCEATSVGPMQTTYVAIVDPRGIMTGSTPTQKRDVLDGLASTILLVEADSGNAVHWMSPQDVDFQAFMNKGTDRSLGGHQGGSHELMADGAVLFITDSIDPGLHETLLTKQARDFPEAFLLP
jgi:hypothetical protein